MQISRVRSYQRKYTVYERTNHFILQICPIHAIVEDILDIVVERGLNIVWSVQTGKQINFNTIAQ
jgi:hypothetical protein